MARPTRAELNKAIQRCEQIERWWHESQKEVENLKEDIFLLEKMLEGWEDYKKELVEIRTDALKKRNEYDAFIQEREHVAIETQRVLNARYKVMKGHGMIDKQTEAALKRVGF